MKLEAEIVSSVSSGRSAIYSDEEEDEEEEEEEDFEDHDLSSTSQ